MHKEMYTFTDRSDRSLTLRPEGTAPIARAYLEHGMQREPQPVKAYTIAPMYRYGRPGRGRHREHYQLSVEAIGSDDPALDAEVIELYTEILRRIGVTQWELHLNSIGDEHCRPAYVEQLTAWLDAHDDLLDEEARHKRATSPLQVFDVKNPKLREALAGRAEDRRVALRRMPRPLRPRSAAPDRARRALRARPDARARPRLLHPHDVRVHRPGRERQLDDLRRRALRRPRAGGRRARRRRGSGSAPASSGCCSPSRTRAAAWELAARRRVRRRRRRLARDGADRAAATAARRASPPTWTTPGARRRDSCRRRRARARRRS